MLLFSVVPTSPFGCCYFSNKKMYYLFLRREHGTVEVNHSRLDSYEEEFGYPSSVRFDEVDHRSVQEDTVGRSEHEGSVTNGSTVSVVGMDYEDSDSDRT